MATMRKARPAFPSTMTPPVPGPWNPGLRSPMPRVVQPLCTLYRPENTFTSCIEIRELADFTGLPEVELVSFRPRRLAVHELLIRVAANISIPDETDPDALGVNFRSVARIVESRYLDPIGDAIDAAYRALRARILKRAESAIEEALTAIEDTGPAPPPPGTWRTRLGIARPHPRPGERPSRLEREDRAMAAWQGALVDGDREGKALHLALTQVVDAVRARHGRVLGDAGLLSRLVADRVCNRLGSEDVGHLTEARIEAAIGAEGLRRLPAQQRPVVMNCKGASASGKSSLRPRQRELARRIGVDWADFAVLSPDIFRKYLLDYEALGDAHRYAGMLTGEELAIVDGKLDRYMAEKAARGGMPHLLIDRFRFDSFAPHSDEPGSNLLTRFGSDIYLFFLVTPPHATVERAWERGLRVGRYKSVDDLLHHNVEAYTGMPELFFTWARDETRNVHYEFLDNDVPQGEAPRTIAFGANGDLVVLDIPAMLNIERFRKIHVGARSPDAVYPDASRLAPARNLGFLRACLARLRQVEFADSHRARVYLRSEAGRAALTDEAALAAARRCPDTAAALAALFPGLGDPGGPRARPERQTGMIPGPGLDRNELPTVGRWGTMRAP